MSAEITMGAPSAPSTATSMTRSRPCAVLMYLNITMSSGETVTAAAGPRRTRPTSPSSSAPAARRTPASFWSALFAALATSDRNASSSALPRNFSAVVPLRDTRTACASCSAEYALSDVERGRALAVAVAFAVTLAARKGVDDGVDVVGANEEADEDTDVPWGAGCPVVADGVAGVGDMPVAGGVEETADTTAALGEPCAGCGASTALEATAGTCDDGSGGSMAFEATAGTCDEGSAGAVVSACSSGTADGSPVTEETTGKSSDVATADVDSTAAASVEDAEPSMDDGGSAGAVVTTADWVAVAS
eukprot:Opistho-1_new@35771